ncbi:MAG: alpha/beta hydrolase [Pseudomonadota bacterium]
MFGLIAATSEGIAETVDEVRGVPYVTLRDRDSDMDEGVSYDDERSSPKAGHCILEQTNLDFLSPAAELAPFYIPEEILSVREIREKPLPQVLDTLSAAPVLYVHGYFIDFDKGCRRATILKEKARLTDRFLWFSWPSDGTLLNYAQDEVNLYWSVPDLVQLISELHGRFGSDGLNLVGHSLGGRGVVLALQEIARSRPDLRINNVALLAPDMDFGLFQKLLPDLSSAARRITIYTSDADRALVVSAQLHGYPRLGQSGNAVGSLAEVEVIDTSDLPTLSPNGHLYHIHNDEVAQDLDRLINNGLPASARSDLIQIGPNQWSLQPVD